MAAKDPAGRPDQYDRARSRRARRRAMGRLLGQPEGGRRAGERHRHSGVLPDQGAVPPQGQVPRHPRLLRRMLRRREEARPARDRAHESGPELGGRRAGASGVVPARRAGQGGAPHGRPAAVPHLHVHHVHDRLHAGDHEGDQLALRRGRHVHECLAAARLAAGLPLRAVQEPAAGGYDRVLGEVQRAHDVPVEAVRFHREGEEAGELLLRQPGRRHPQHRRPGEARAKSASGSSATTRAAAATTRRSGDARCRAACATPCRRARWRPT